MLDNKRLKYFPAQTFDSFLSAWAWSLAYSCCSALGKEWLIEFPGSYDGEKDVMIAQTSGDIDRWNIYMMIPKVDLKLSTLEITKRLDNLFMTIIPPGLYLEDYEVRINSYHQADNSSGANVEIEVIISDRVSDNGDGKPGLEDNCGQYTILDANLEILYKKED